jgi:hypothetical protein
MKSSQGCRFSFFTQKHRFFGIENAFSNKIQNAAYSYSESWHTRDSAGAVDGQEDATFARPAHTKEALPGPGGLEKGSQGELVQMTIHQGICRHFITIRFLPGFLL